MAGNTVHSDTEATGTDQTGGFSLRVHEKEELF